MPGKFTAFTKSTVIVQKLKEQNHYDNANGDGNNSTISDLTEKKLFSYMYSDASAVEA